MLLEPLKTISWAYQLHYYLCFRTRRCRSIFTTPEHVEALETELREICERHEYHLLQSKVYPDHLRCLLSLRPAQAISTVIRTIKANSARLFNAQFALTPPPQGTRLFGAQRRARAPGSGQTVHQRAGRTSRVREACPPTGFPLQRGRSRDADGCARQLRVEPSSGLRHAVSPRGLRFRFGRRTDSILAAAPASARGFAIDRVTAVPDHTHLLVRIAPKMSIEECALALLNNGQHFVGQHAPESLIQARIEQLWQASAYAGTTGKVTTALVKTFLSERE